MSHLKSALRYVDLYIITLEQYKKKMKRTHYKPRKKPNIDPEIIRKAIEMLQVNPVPKEKRTQDSIIKTQEEIPIIYKRPPAVYSNENWKEKYNNI